MTGDEPNGAVAPVVLDGRARDQVAGEVRAVGQMEPRLAEAAKMGFKTVVLPAGSARRLEERRLEPLGVETLGEALRLLFP